MLTIALLLAAVALLSLAFADKALRVLPLTPAVLYLCIGAAAGSAVGAPSMQSLATYAVPIRVALELALLVSLFAIGLRLRIAPTWRAWRVALLLAGPAMLVTISVVAAAAVWGYGWSWGLALVVASILAPTDPVLASEVQVHSAHDRDELRLSLTAEGAMNDGTALPAIVIGLWLLASAGGPAELDGWTALAWPVFGGAAIGVALGYALGMVIHARVRAGDALARDELLLLGGVTLSYGVALASGTSAFVLGFAVAVTLLQPLRRDTLTPSELPLAERLHAFGSRIERLVEALSVVAVGIALFIVPPTLQMLVLALVLLLAARPLAVLLTVPPKWVSSHQRGLLAWFGIRGVGSLYYLAYSLEHGLNAENASLMVGTVMTALAASIVLHGLSVTRLMDSYKQRRGR